MHNALHKMTARGAAFVLVGVAVISGATSAHAWTLGTQLGTMTVTPSSGLDTYSLAVSTTGTCPSPATNVQAYIYGSGFPADGQAVTPNESIGILDQTPTGGYGVNLQDTLRKFADMQMPPAVLSGAYTLAVVCRGTFGTADYGDYETTITFTDPTHYTSGTPVATATTTTLTATPPATAVTGAAVTLTAAVTPAGAAGSVKFLDGSAAVGTAPVTGAAATLTTTALAAGSHSLTAVFTPTAPVGATPSTSAALSYVIAVPSPVVSRPSALVLTVGTKFSCPDGAKETVPAAAVGKAASCAAGGPSIVGAKGVAPLALVSPSLTGTGKVGTKLTLKPGLWTPAYTSRTVVWKRDGKVIAKASGAAYTVTKADKGHKISATVIAHLAGHIDGTASTSSAKAKGIVAGAMLSSASLKDTTDTTANAKPISVPVGSVIGCVPGAFTGATTTTSAWFVDGVQASTSPALVLGDKAVGHSVVCRTTGTNAGGTAVSDATVTVVPGAALLPYVQPRVVGTAKVGKKLIAIAGKWYPVYAKATFVWLRNGKAIKGATKATYVLATADKKHKISVRVTATRTGWGVGKAVSVAVSVG